MDNSYDYKGYQIIDSQISGVWDIKDVGRSFSTSEDAEYFIDHHIERIYHNVTHVGIINTEENDLPVNKTTYKQMKKKYFDCSGKIYLLKHDGNNNKYASNSGLCEYESDEMLVFKSKEAAQDTNMNRSGKYHVVIKKFNVEV